jgi:hypothetical protein
VAINQLQIPQPNINSTVDPSMWGALGNLGNVYQKAQEDAKQRETLAQLGQSPEADALTLLHSGIPSLAQIGINLRQRGIDQAREDQRFKITDARADADLAMRQAAEARAQGDYDEATQKEAAARKALLALPFGQQAAPPAAAPSFPAPLPGAAPQTVLPQQAPPVAPPAGPAPPMLPAPPAGPAAPSPIAPSEVAATTSAAPPSVVDRMADTLASGRPPATAGITRQQIADLYADPSTRPLATTFLQTMFGENKPTVVKEGERLVVKRPDGSYQDITPGGSVSKEEREAQGYFKAGKSLGMNDDEAKAFAANKGKTPSQDLRPAEEKRVSSLTDEMKTAQRVLDNVKQLREVSKSAWGFTGAGPASLLAATILPNSVASATGAVDTQDLINAAHSNVANVAKTIFPQRVTNMDVTLLKDLESSASQPDVVRQKIYDRAEKVFGQIIRENDAEAEGIREKKFYKPGGGDAVRRASGVETSSGGPNTPALKWSIVPGS